MPPSEAKPERERKRFVTPFPSKRLTDVSEVAEQLALLWQIVGFVVLYRIPESIFQ